VCTAPAIQLDRQRLKRTRYQGPDQATPKHRRRWRSTNLLERSLGEVKRRTKVMGRFPGEDSCLSLVWAVLDLLITHETNGIRFNQLDRQRLKRTSYQGTDQATPKEVTAA
jgi:putative transposase